MRSEAMDRVRECFQFYYGAGPDPQPCVISMQGLSTFRNDVIFFNIRDDDALFGYSVDLT